MIAGLNIQNSSPQKARPDRFHPDCVPMAQTGPVSDCGIESGPEFRGPSTLWNSPQQWKFWLPALGYSIKALRGQSLPHACET
jgi:hypothetical protein